MLLQTNSYLVPKERRTEHARLLQRFRQLMARLGCDHFEVYEQTGHLWGTGEPSGRFVQILRFRDKQHWQAVQAAEKNDPQAGKLIAEFCDLINLPYQQQAGLFAATFFNSVIVSAPARVPSATPSLPPTMPAASAGAVDNGVLPTTPAVDEPEPAEALAQMDDSTPSTADALAELDALDAQVSDASAPAELDAANGDVDVLDYLSDTTAGDAEKAERQRID